MAKLGKVCDVRDGTHDSPKYVENGYPLITSKNLSSGSIDFSDVNYISEEDYTKINQRSKVDIGDIIMPMIGTIGNPVIVDIEPVFAIKNVSLIKFINEEVYNRYILYVLDSDYFKRYIDGKNRGGTQKFISLNDIREFDFVLPDLLTQRQIAANLDKVTRTIDLCNAILEKLDLLVKSRFVEMFCNTDDRRTIADICSIITDGTHQPPKFTQDGIPFLFVSNIVTNEITYNAEKFISEETYDELYKRTPIEIGDIVLSTVGSYGHPAVVKTNKKFLFQRHIAYLKPISSVVNSIYLHSAILSNDAQRQIEERVKGIAQKTLNLSEIRKITVPIPPLALQEQFAAFVEQTDKSKLAVKQVLEKAETLKKALMQEYFG